MTRPSEKEKGESVLFWIDRACGRLYVEDRAGVIIGGGRNQIFGGRILTIEKEGGRAGSYIACSIDLNAVLKAIKADGKILKLDDL